MDPVDWNVPRFLFLFIFSLLQHFKITVTVKPDVCFVSSWSAAHRSPPVFCLSGVLRPHAGGPQEEDGREHRQKRAERQEEEKALLHTLTSPSRSTWQRAKTKRRSDGRTDGLGQRLQTRTCLTTAQLRYKHFIRWGARTLFLTCTFIWAFIVKPESVFFSSKCIKCESRRVRGRIYQKVSLPLLLLLFVWWLGSVLVLLPLYVQIVWSPNTLCGQKYVDASPIFDSCSSSSVNVPFFLPHVEPAAGIWSHADSRTSSRSYRDDGDQVWSRVGVQVPPHAFSLWSWICL